MLAPIQLLALESYLSWTTLMEYVLTNVIVDPHVVGNHLSNGWKTPVYTTTKRSVVLL